MKYCDEYVCLSVSLLSYLKNHTAKLRQIFVHDFYGRGLFLLWQHCTFSFLDDISIQTRVAINRVTYVTAVTYS